MKTRVNLTASDSRGQPPRQTRPDGWRRTVGDIADDVSRREIRPVQQAKRQRVQGECERSKTNLSGLTTFLPDLSLRPRVAKSVLRRWEGRRTPQGTGGSVSQIEWEDEEGQFRSR